MLSIAGAIVGMLFIVVVSILVIDSLRKSTVAVQTVHKKLVEMATEVTAIHHDSVEINTAVNHKDRGMPTLVQRVLDQDTRGLQLATDLAASTDWERGALQAIALPLNAELPPTPPTVPPTEVVT
jgi:hypothetical protein